MAEEIIAQSEDVTPKQPRDWRKLGILFFLIGLAIFICAFAVGFFALAQNNMRLSRQVTQVQTSLSEQDQQLASLQQTISRLQQDNEQVSRLSQKQQQMMSNWQSLKKEDLTDWQVAEAHYLTRLANDILQFSGNTDTATVLLERADQALQSENNPRLFNLREALATDIAKLKSIPKLDITGAFLQLSALNTQIEHLPFPESPLQANQNGMAAAKPEDAWWQRGLDHTWQVLQKIIIVRKTEADMPPLVMPDERKYLIQNLHAQIDTAIWGLLYRNPTVFQSGLHNLNTWIQNYFAVDAEPTKAFLQNISSLRELHVEKPSVDLTTTLNLFNEFLTQVKPQPVS